MSEQERPSVIVIVSTVIPFALLATVWLLTHGFSENPPYPPFFSKILPLALTVIAVLTSIFAYNLARDEEPEWGAELRIRLQYKVLEGAAIACVTVSLVFAILILIIYFL